MIERLIKWMNCCKDIPFIDDRRSNTGTLTTFCRDNGECDQAWII